MKQKIFSFLICLILVVSLSVTASAAANLPMVVDSANLLSAEEHTALEEKTQSVRSEYEMDIVILTVNSLDGKRAQDFADDYYDTNGYGYGEQYSGILFLLAMDEREWYISTCGEAIYAVTDYGVQQLGETALWYLSDGEYYYAFEAYLDELSSYLEAYRQGSPMDGYADYSGDYSHGDQEAIVYYEEEYSPSFFLSLVIGIIAASVTVLIMRASMNTRQKQHSASGYLKAGSFHLKKQQDMFLYSNVNKVRKQQNSTGSSGGGSSVHHSSGGRRHGGGGGRF